MSADGPGNNRSKFNDQVQVEAFNANSEIDINKEKGHPRWLDVWNKGLEKGDLFDATCPSPALVKEIIEGRVPNGKALGK